MTEIKALLFDLDGTLVDTREPNFRAYEDAFAQAQYALDRPTFESTWGQDSRDFIPRLMPTAGQAQIDQIRATKGERYPHYLGTAVPNTALIGFLRAMAPLMKTALVTTAKTANGQAVLEAFDIQDCFDVTVFGETVQRGKPHPEAYLEALNLLGVEAREALAFEDSDTGAQAAVAAGVAVVRIGAFA